MFRQTPAVLVLTSTFVQDGLLLGQTAGHLVQQQQDQITLMEM